MKRGVCLRSPGVEPLLELIEYYQDFLANWDPQALPKGLEQLGERNVCRNLRKTPSQRFEQPDLRIRRRGLDADRDHVRG
jgi:hypothetical protein